MEPVRWKPASGDIVSHVNVEGTVEYAIVNLKTCKNNTYCLTPRLHTFLIDDEKLTLINSADSNFSVTVGNQYRYFCVDDGSFMSCRCEAVVNELVTITLLETRKVVKKVHKNWLRRLHESCPLDDTVHQEDSVQNPDEEIGGIIEEDSWNYESPCESRSSSPCPEREQRCDSPEPSTLKPPPEETFVLKSKMRKELQRLKKGSQGDILDREVAELGKPIRGNDFFTHKGELLTARLPKRRVFTIHFAGRVSKPFMVGWVKNRLRNNCESDQEVEIGALGLYRYENTVRGWTTNIIVGQHSQVYFTPADDKHFRKFAELLKEGHHEVPAFELRGLEDVRSCPFFNKEVNPREPDLASVGAVESDEDEPEYEPAQDEDMPDQPAQDEEMPDDVQCQEWQCVIPFKEASEVVHERFETSRAVPYNPVKPYVCRDTGIIVYDKHKKSEKSVSWAKKHAYNVIDINTMACDEEVDICSLFESLNLWDQYEPMQDLMKCPWFISALKPVEAVFCQLVPSCKTLTNHPLDNLVEHMARVFSVTEEPARWCPSDRTNDEIVRMKQSLLMPSCTFFDIMGPLIKFYTSGSFLYVPESKFDGHWTRNERSDVEAAEVLCCILNGVAFCICKKAKKIAFISPTCGGQIHYFDTKKVEGEMTSEVFRVTHVEKRKLCALLGAIGEDVKDYAMVSIELPGSMARKYMYALCPTYLLMLVNVLLHSRTRSGMYQPILRASKGHKHYKCLFLHNVRALNFKTLGQGTIRSTIMACLRLTHSAYEVAFAVFHKEPFYPYSNQVEPRDISEDVDELFTAKRSKRARTRSERRSIQPFYEIGNVSEQAYENISNIFKEKTRKPPLQVDEDNIIDKVDDMLKEELDALDIERLHNTLPTHYLMWLKMRDFDESFRDASSILEKTEVENRHETREIKSRFAYSFPLDS